MLDVRFVGYRINGYVMSELSTGPFCVTRSNPTHQLTDPKSPNPTHYKWKNLDPTRPNPIQLTMDLTV